MQLIANHHVLVYFSICWYSACPWMDGHIKLLW